MLKPFMKLCINAFKTDERMLQGFDFCSLMGLKTRRKNAFLPRRRVTLVDLLLTQIVQEMAVPETFPSFPTS